MGETERDEQSFTDRRKDGVKSPDPLKPPLDFAISRLELQIQKLDQGEDRFSQKDKAILTKIVDAYKKHDTAFACVFANELAEVRKISFLIIKSRLALEQISFRLRTMSDQSDIVPALEPCVEALRTVKSALANVFPETESEFEEIDNMLSKITIEAGQSSGIKLNLNAVNEEADKILTEATTVARQTIKEKFSDSPPSLPDTA